MPTAGVAFKLRVTGTFLSTDDRVRIVDAPTVRLAGERLRVQGRL